MRMYPSSFAAPADPRLDVFSASARTAISSNADWGGGAEMASVFARVGAFPLPAASKDSAVVGLLPVAGYTARVTSSLAGGSGVALANAFAAAAAFALPASSKDAVVVVNLPPGGYTVTVTGIPYTNGRALVEIYDLDP